MILSIIWLLAVLATGIDFTIQGPLVVGVVFLFAFVFFSFGFASYERRRRTWRR